MISCRSYRPTVHSCHFFQSEVGKGSSHPNGKLSFPFSFPSIVSCRSRSLPGHVTGVAKPRGSYIELITDRTPRRVKGFSGKEMENVNASFCKFHMTPKER